VTRVLSIDDLKCPPRYYLLPTNGGDYTRYTECQEFLTAVKFGNGDDWQQWQLQEMLNLAPDDIWAARTAAIEAPRQNGKTWTVEARVLYGMVMLGEHIVWSAQNLLTAGKSFEHLKAVILDTPALMARLIGRPRERAGEQGFRFKGGGELQFVARGSSGGNGRGFTVIDLIVWDEALKLGEHGHSAFVPTQGVSRNPQTIYTSTPGFPDEEDSQIWANIVRQGRNGITSGDDFFADWCATEEDDVSLPETWAAANPGFPHRLSEKTLRHFHNKMLPESFAREILGIWGFPSATPGDLSIEQWMQLELDHVGPVVPSVLAADMNFERTHVSVVAVMDIDGTPVVELVERAPFERPIFVARMAELGAEFPGVTLVVDGDGPLASLVADLQEANVFVYVRQAVEYQSDCALLADGVRSGLFRQLPCTEFDSAVAVIRKRPRGEGRFVWARRGARGDIAPIVAATLGYGYFVSGGVQFVF